MALPALPLVLGGGALLALLLSSSKSSAAPGAPGTPPGGGAAPGKPGTVPGLNVPVPANWDEAAARQKISAAATALAQNGTDQDAMDAAAAELEKHGFVTEATMLRARAAQLRGQGKKVEPPPSPPPMPTPPTPPGVEPPPAPPPPPAIPSLTEPKFAVVTTNDPAPSGDLYIVPTPGAPGIPGVGAEKNGTVAVLNWNATPDYAQVVWPGGARLGPVTGYAKKKFLVPSASAPLPLPNVTPAQGQMARVTTSSPAPDGDLIIRSTPGGTQIGGAAKDSLVQVLEWNAGTSGGVAWSKITATQAAQNWPAATGYVKQQYLRLQPAISGMSRDIISGNGRNAVVLNHGGVRMWQRAGGGALLDILPYGERLELVKLVPGPKADLRSKGPGGWAFVRRVTPGSTSHHVAGWVPSEWLAV